MLTPQDVANKWVQGLSASTDAIRRGVERVTEAPTAAAARQVDLWQSQVSSQQTREKFVRGLQRISLEEWRQAMLQKGVARVATGAQAGKAKMEMFMSEFLPFVESIAARVRAMPKTTLEDRIQRMVTQVRETAGFRRQR